MAIVEKARALVARAKAAVGSVMAVPEHGNAWSRITEPFTGAWQRNIAWVNRNSDISERDRQTYSTIYACMSRISTDIGKLPFALRRRDSNGLWRNDTHQSVSPLLRRPNHFQTPAQFREAWILSKLQSGNTYALKGRDERGAVSDLWILDPWKVKPCVSESGDVFYRLNYGVNENLLPSKYSGDEFMIPASEIIHDREMALFHPLLGMAPLEAATLAVRKNVQIQRNAADFFANAARPGGLLTAPAGMSDEDAKAITEYWDKNFSGPNSGKVGVIGADMKFVSFAFNAVDSQMVEQLRYSDEQMCHAFGIPPFKVGIGTIPAGLKVDDLNQMYYADALQARIEAMEDCLDAGLRLGDDVGVELDLEPLLRMDPGKQAEVHAKLTGGGIETPNEARRKFGLAPLTGGDSVYLQQQNYSLEALARRDASADPFGTGPSEERALRSLPAPLTAKRKVRYNHDDGTFDVELSNGQWLRRVRRDQLAA